MNNHYEQTDRGMDHIDVAETIGSALYAVFALFVAIICGGLAGVLYLTFHVL